MPLSVVLNGEQQREPALAFDSAGEVYLRLADARAMGIRPAPGDRIVTVEHEDYLALDPAGAPPASRRPASGAPISGHLTSVRPTSRPPVSTPSVVGRITPDGTLEITAAAAAFAPRRLGDGVRPLVLSRIVPAAFLDYDVNVQRDDGKGGNGNLRATALLEGTVSGAWGVFSTSGVLAHGYGASSGQAGTVRLDSSYLRDFPARRLRLVIGDTLTRGSSWTGPARIGGFRFGTEFSLDPERLTWPLPELAGSSVLPSTLELVARQDRRDIPLAPGDFTYAWRPQFSGAGTVTMTLRDISGTVRTVTRSYYASQGLLRPGLVDFSVEAGALRRNYGLASFDYGGLMAGATLRRGMSDHLTLEGRAEAGSGTVMGGAGGTVLLGNWAEVNLGAALSHSAAGNGHLVQVQAQRLTQSYSLTASYRLRSARFRQVGETVLPDSGASRELALTGSLAFGRAGSVTAGYLRVSEGTSHYSIASLGWSGNWRDAYISLGAQRILRGSGVGGTSGKGNDTSLIAGLTVPLGGGRNASLSVEPDRSVAAIDRSPPGNLGLGYHLAGGYENGMGPTLEGQLEWRAGFGQIDVAGLYRDGTISSRVELRGGLVAAGGSLAATPHIDDALAVVDVLSDARVTVMIENRPSGSHAGNGHRAIVAGLQAYSPNRISIDPDQQPLENALDTAEKTATPGWRQAARVTFGGRSGTPVRLRLLDPSGAVLAAGMTVTVIDAPPETASVTGHDGEVFLAAYPAGAALRITGGAQGACLVPLPQTAPKDTLATPLVMICRPDTRLARP